MNVRIIAVALAALVAVSVAIAFAVTASSDNTSTPANKPRPIAGILSESVPNVPDSSLRRAARAFFTSLIERQYRGQTVPIDAATPALAARLQEIAVAGDADTQVAIVAMRYADKPDGVRQVTVQVDQHLGDGSTQPLAANFRQAGGDWRAISLPTLDGDTHSPEPSPARTAPPAAVRAVRAYARAARSWTPNTLRANYDRQVRLSVGQLRSALRRSPPTAALIDAYRTDDARMTAEISDVQLVSRTDDAITFSVVLVERTTSASDSQTQRTVNTAELELHDGRWLIANFTATP
jgi:hypothetical protein